MRLWIDATGCDGGVRVFGSTLVENLLRGLLAHGPEVDLIRIELPADTPIPHWISPELQARLPIQWSRGDWSLPKRLQHALQDAAGEPLIAVTADSVVDPRLYDHLVRTVGNVAFLSGPSSGNGVLLKLESELPDAGDAPLDLAAIADRAIRSGTAKTFSADHFDGYIVNLRREVAPYLIRIRDSADLDRVERLLFRLNYKGSTDFMTSHVYPPLVWLLVRPLARWRVHPNWVTSFDILLAIAVIPLFAAGAWAVALGLAYLMTVLDSVDGKLARLTHRSSRLGNLLDHGTDIVHPPLWYLAWGYALGDGDLASPAFTLSLWMFGLYVADRLCAPLFMWRTGRSIHGFTQLDERVRTFVSRRNVNLPVMTVALASDGLLETALAVPTFAALVAWQAVCLTFHATRVVQFWRRRETPGE